jgi:predicted metalloprotease with PDZ domain
MKKIQLAAFLFILASVAVKAQENKDLKYQAYVDLTSVSDDMLKVVIDVPPVDSDKIIFRFPKMVPGTYTIYDFGRFISDFQALDFDGMPLRVEIIDENSWQIHDAQALNIISYKVEDTYDTQKSNVVFEPAGSNIEANKNFVLNNHAFFGYLDGLTNIPYELTFTKPIGFYGASTLEKKYQSQQKDTFIAPSYFDLVDSPIMYSIADTASFTVATTKINIAVYSPNKVLKADFVSANVKEIIEASRVYLGGTLPVDRYDFIIYLTDNYTLSGAMGALEHSYSSMYVLPEFNPLALVQTIKDISAHEFLHIITPLNIHSEQISNFDFANPKMSRHLWLYEGVTEYFSTHIQVRQALISKDAYLKVILEKIKGADRYVDNLAFTELSLGALDQYKSQYANVYEKGALIGLSLDLLITEKSNGKYSLQKLLADLSKKYGKDTPFKDEDLFSEIVTLTDPSVAIFFENHVAGSTPIPYQDVLFKAGIQLELPSKERELTLGNVNFSVDAETQRFVVTNTVGLNSFGRKLGYQAGDILLKLNKQEITFKNYLAFFEDFKKNGREGERVRFTVLREKKGKQKKVVLKAIAESVEISANYKISWIQNPTSDQLKLKKNWLGLP